MKTFIKAASSGLGVLLEVMLIVTMAKDLYDSYKERKRQKQTEEPSAPESEELVTENE